MKKFKVFLLSLALIVGVGGAFAFERPDLLGVKRNPCYDTWPSCLAYTQYVVGCNGEMVLAPQGGEGSSWVCKYNPSYVCTYAYIYCGQWGPDDWRFIPCKKGNFCWFTETYQCDPCPPWSSLSGKDSVIIPTEFQKKKMEEATKEFLEQN